MSVLADAGGQRDLTISPEESRSIAHALGTECRFQLFEGLGHQPLQAGNSAMWDQEVRGFLSRLKSQENQTQIRP